MRQSEAGSERLPGTPAANAATGNAGHTHVAAPGEMSAMAQAAMAPDETPEKPVPKRIGRYPIRRKLGEGGMGTVYLAWHPELAIPVAIKTIHQSLASDETQAKRFLQEARVVCRLNHPNVIRVYDVDREQDGRPFIVQEYVPGGDLSQALDATADGRLEIGAALRIARGVASALVEADRHGVVHRDVKPSNILLAADGQPKLADLGIAKPQPATLDSDTTENLTRSFSSLGSPLYMAPEQLVDARSVDGRADIYSLGVTLYKMLTGELPFAAKSPEEMVVKHRHEALPNAREIRPEIPPATAHVLRRMLARSPANRYQTATELLAAVDELIEPRRRWPARRWLGAAALVALGAATVLLMNGRRPGPQALADMEYCLAGGNAGRALAAAKSALRTRPNSVEALYGLGLCAVRLGHDDEVKQTIAQLNGTPGGLECARHLQTALLARHQPAAAQEMARRWSREARHKAPFLLTLARIELQEKHVDEAERLLTAAVDAPALLNFQHISAAEELARLRLSRGEPDAAAATYREALAKTGPLTPPASFYTGYAVALMESGARDQAAEVLRRAAQRHPGDEMLNYLQTRAETELLQAESQELSHTLDALGELNAALQQREAGGATASSTPIILLFLRPPAGPGLTDAGLWAERISRRVQQQGIFPAVNRRHFAPLLAELKLSSSEAVAEETRVGLGRLWAASTLVETKVLAEAGGVRVSLYLTDVATSELVAIVERVVPLDAPMSAAADQLCAQLTDALRQQARPFGRVTAVNDSRISIDIGLCHGLSRGQTLRICAVADGDTDQTIARASVESLDRFTGTAVMAPSVSPSAVTAGMAVVADPVDRGAAGPVPPAAVPQRQ